MLQIISGKFFGEGEVNEEESYGVLYSNYSWIQDIPSGMVSLHRKTCESALPATYVARYVARYESDGGPIVMPATTTVLEQFRLLCSFYFRAVFHSDRTHVELLTRQIPRHSADHTYPSAFLRRYFDMPIHGTYEEICGFPAFFEKVISMPRASYNLYMSCLTIFFNALEACSSNLDLAYSMIVYALEALSKSQDSYEPVWEDHPKQANLDRIFRPLEQDVCANIRKVLLKDAHLKLSGRFIATISNLVDDSFFLEEAKEVSHPIPRSELARALKNLYASRSGFVHSLSPVHEQIKMPTISKETDYITWQDDPHLTFSGLVRLARHALLSFVKGQDTVDLEEYPWRNELEGVVRGELAPQFWMWQPDNYCPKQSHHRLGGFIAYLTHEMSQNDFGIPDMRPLMSRIEELFGQSNDEQKLSMFTHYGIYNSLIVPSIRSTGADAFINKHSGQMQRTCSIQDLLADLFVKGVEIDSTGDERAAAFNKYKREKYRRGSLSIPNKTEVAIMIGIANTFLASGDVDQYRDWTRRAELDAGFNPDLQVLMAAANSIEAPIDPYRDVLNVAKGRITPPEHVVAWTLQDQVESVPTEHLLQIKVEAPAIIKCSADDWNSVFHFATKENEAIFYADLNASPGSEVEFTFFWIESRSWEGRNFSVHFDSPNPTDC